jgi:hypothetical protein
VQHNARAPVSSAADPQPTSQGPLIFGGANNGSDGPAAPQPRWLKAQPARLEQALQRLLPSAPGPVFPRARRLYFDKYPLEGLPADLDAAAVPGRFRTFVLRDTSTESAEGAVTTRVHELALVHWQSPQTNDADYRTYLQQQWQLHPLALVLESESWFREGGAWARVTLPGADPAPVAAAPDSNP